MNKQAVKLLLELLTEDSNDVKETRSVGQNILVLDRGFVYVGDVMVNGDELLVTNARNVRVWGTTNGLGELRNGPLSSTKLDVVGEVVIPLKALIHRIPCKGF
jgi:hypothetical protein